MHDSLIDNLKSKNPEIQEKFPEIILNSCGIFQEVNADEFDYDHYIKEHDARVGGYIVYQILNIAKCR